MWTDNERPPTIPINAKPQRHRATSTDTKVTQGFQPGFRTLMKRNG